MNRALLLCKQVALGRTLSASLCAGSLIGSVQIAATSRAALCELHDILYDILIIADSLQDMATLELVSFAKATLGDLKILAMGNDVRGETALDAYRAGADGYLPFDADREAIDLCLRSMARNMVLIKGDTFSHCLDRQSAPCQLTPNLSKNDLDILRLVSEGMSNTDIAGRLFYSENTIKYKISALMNRYDVHSRVQLAVYAVRNNLV